MIQTRPRTRWVIQMSLMTVMCAVFGVWGWYDYSVKIPMDELGYQKLVAFTNVKSGLEAQANGETNALQTAVQGVQAARQELTASMTEAEVEQLKSVRQEMESQFKAELQRAREEGLVSVEFNYTTELGTVAKSRLRWWLEIDRLGLGLLAVDQADGRVAAMRLPTLWKGFPRESPHIKNFQYPTNGTGWCSGSSFCVAPTPWWLDCT
jgi:hypothetical protein